MEKPQDLQFDFDHYLKKLMEALEMDSAEAALKTSIQKELSKQIGYTITQTIAEMLSNEEWSKLQKKVPEGSIQELLETAIELHPNLNEILTERLEVLFEEMLETYQALKK